METLFRKFKSNNKGNTLAIVLIGIVVVGVIGTVMLQSTSVNFNMKASNLKTKQNFYYAEMAVDDIYSKLGKEVSDAAEDAYNEALSTYVNTNTAIYNVSTEADKTFRDTYLNHFVNKPEFSNHMGNIDAVIANLSSYIDTTKYSAVGVTIRLDKIVGTAADFSDSTSVSHKDDDSDSYIDRIIIRNVKVTSTTNTNGYSSSITTDFEITVPQISFDFSDLSEDDYESFFEFSLVANGDLENRNNPDANTEEGAILVGNNSKIKVNGNVYAGGDHHRTTTESYGLHVINKDGIYIKEGSSFETNSSNVLSKGSVVLQGLNTKFKVDGETLLTNKYIGSEDEAKSARVYAKDLILQGKNANMAIDGECYVKDDLEVNGDTEEVAITGSYYGFGYSGNEANLNRGIVSENKTNVTSGFTSEGTPVLEHQSRSAIIVNGNEADVQLAMAGGKQVVVGGRAYIDLTTGLADGSGATYMTGESVSIKGNQKIYLLDDPSVYQTLSNEGLRISGNPADLGNLLSAAQTYAGINPSSYTADQFYDAFGIDRNNMIAKRIGNSVYFYMKENDPDVLTERVVEMVRNTTTSAYDTMVDAVGAGHGMAVKNLRFGDGTSSYTVGTAMQVVDGNLATGRNLPSGDNGISDDEFCAIIKDVRNRYGNVMYNVYDDRNNPSTRSEVGSSSKVVNEVPVGSEDKSPFDVFIQRSMLEGLREQTYRFGEYHNTSWPNSSYAINPDISSSELAKLNIPTNKITVVVRDGREDAGYTTSNCNPQNGVAYGIIVTLGDVTVNCDFNGMIIAGGDIKISGNHTFTANPNMISLIRNKSDFMHALISGSVAPRLSSTTGDLISGLSDKGFTFDSFLSMTNWRKNIE